MLAQAGVFGKVGNCFCRELFFSRTHGGARAGRIKSDPLEGQRRTYY